MNEAARERLVIGRITGCYGIKGWVRIHSFTEPMENFLEFKGVKVQRRGGYEAIEFDQGRRQGKGLVAHIRGVDDRDLAETFQGLEVSVDSDALPNWKRAIITGPSCRVCRCGVTRTTVRCCSAQSIT